MTQSTNPFDNIRAELNDLSEKIEELTKIANKIDSSRIENTNEIGGISLAQEITGLAKPTIYALVSHGEIPYMKKAKKLYFSREELTSWIKQGRKKTTEEKESCLKITSNKRRK